MFDVLSVMILARNLLIGSVQDVYFPNYLFYMIQIMNKRQTTICLVNVNMSNQDVGELNHADFTFPSKKRLKVAHINVRSLRNKTSDSKDKLQFW